MAVVNLKGSRVMTPIAASPAVKAPPGTGGGAIRSWTETIETGSDDLASSTYLMARLPSNARIMGMSKISWDDLGTTAVTLDVGVYNQSGKSDITDDPDALSNGHDAATAGSGDLVAGIVNYGIPLWDFVNGQSSDPGAILDIKVALQDATITAAGTITVEILYTLD